MSTFLHSVLSADGLTKFICTRRGVATSEIYVRKLFRNSLILLVLASGAQAESEADKVYQQAEKAERAGDILQAYLLYARAAELDPANLAIQDHRNRAAARAMENATVHDANNQPDPEAAFYQLIATQGPTQVDAFGPAEPPPHLESNGAKKRFDLQGDAETLFKQVGDAFGVAIIIEPNYQGPRPFQFRTGELDMFEAFRALEALANSVVEPINARTALVFRDTPQRRSEATHVSTVAIPIPQRISAQDAQEIVTCVQQAAEIRRVQVDPLRRLVVLRDSASKLIVAEKLFEELSRLRSQVELEVQLMTVTRNSNLAIGLTLPTSSQIINFGNFLNNQISAQGFTNFLSFGGGKSLFGLGVAAAQLFATLSDARSQSLLSSQMVALDGQAASLNVGTRFPIATAQYLGATGPTLSTPTPTVSYQDLGLVLKVTPTVHAEGQVTLDIDASFNTLGTLAANGIPSIEQRKFQGKVRLQQSEWAVIAGLTQINDARTSTGILGLGNIPIIGHLFRNDTTEKDSDLTLILIKPRIINLPPWETPAPALSIGTEGRFISLY